MRDLLPELKEFIGSLDSAGLPEERKELLQQIALYLRQKEDDKEEMHLNFICTHNSRRSQLCQVWAQTAAYCYGIEDFAAASGGTETTAFHPNAVKALKDSGFEISCIPEEQNPRYRIKFAEGVKTILCFSKMYDKALPPSTSFAAVLTCADAEANCPYIPEAEARFSLKYDDPKATDGTAQQDEAYSERNRQIATEMFYLFSLIN